MKCNHFYEGLYPKYWQIMAHKMDGKHPASYSDLLLTAGKLERLAQARNPLTSKTASTSGSNMTHFQVPENLFPSHKLKGNGTFTTQAVTVRNGKAEEDSSVKLEGGEMEPLTDKDVEGIRQSRRNRSICQAYHSFC